MRKKTIITALVMSLSILVAPAAMAERPDNAGSPTCAQFFANHGEHVTVHYVTPGEPGGAKGAPAHFGNTDNLGPGASFCLEQANSKALPVRP